MSGDLPEGWQRASLGDVLRLEYGRALSATVREAGDVPVYGSNGRVGFHSTPLVRRRGIVVGRKGTAGSVTVTEGPFWPIDTAYYVEPRQEVDFGWLASVLEHARLSDLNESTGVPGLNRDKVYREAAVIPPLQEQRRIAEVLRVIDEAIEAETKAYEQARTAFAATRTSLTGLDGSNPDWTRGPILDFFQLQRGHDLPVQDRIAGAVPIIASNGTVGFHNVSPVSAPSVVTGRSGTIGKVNYFDGACWPLNTTLFVKDFKGSNPRYVYHFLSAFPLGDYQTGTGVPTLNRNDVHVVEVSWPDRGEQDDFVAALDALESVVMTMKQELDALRALKSQVAADLLSGRVRVPE